MDTKSIIFLITVLVFSNALLLEKSRTNLKTSTKLRECWSYATSDDQYLNEFSSNNNLNFTNQISNIRKKIIYSANETLCSSECEKNRFGHKCYSTRYYDLDIGIPKNSFVCWLSRACPRLFDISQYYMFDPNIKHYKKFACNYLCDAIYGQEGTCLQKTPTAQDIKDKKVDKNYYCFFRGREFAGRSTNRKRFVIPSNSSINASNTTNSTIRNATKF